jgi:hypothetical protein
MPLAVIQHPAFAKLSVEAKLVLLGLFAVCDARGRYQPDKLAEALQHGKYAVSLGIDALVRQGWVRRDHGAIEIIGYQSIPGIPPERKTRLELPTAIGERTALLSRAALEWCRRVAERRREAGGVLESCATSHDVAVDYVDTLLAIQERPGFVASCRAMKPGQMGRGTGNAPIRYLETMVRGWVPDRRARRKRKPQEHFDTDVTSAVGCDSSGSKGGEHGSGS